MTTATAPSQDIAVVVIGRNEGARLVASLASLQAVDARVVYVDSGSTDDSVQVATDAGAQVVELDMSVPFTAARARNAGFAALDPVPDFVQFIDGDCILEPDWIGKGLAAMAANPDLGIVTGWRAEIYPDASVYNAMADFEWHGPVGDIEACGGDMLVRAALFKGLGGFNDKVVAAEDDEFCVRVRRAGRRIHRIPEKMTRHDMDMHHIRQWWQRAVRTGHGFAQVGALHPTYFVRSRQRAWIFGCFLPLTIVTGLVSAAWLVALAGALYLLSYIRTVRGLMRRHLALQHSFHHALLLSLSKVPNLLGMLTYYHRRMGNSDMEIIEYK